jgi:hypothetical protein
MPTPNSAAFINFANATRATRATKPGYLVDLSQRTNYVTSLFLRGKNPFDFATGGTDVQEVVHISNNRSGKVINPGDIRSVNAQADSRVIKTTTRLAVTHVQFTEDQINRNVKNGSDFERAKNYEAMINQQDDRSHLEMLENFYFARPNSLTMDTTGAGEDPGTITSIPAIITEDPLRRLPPNLDSDGVTAAGWQKTTLFGVDRLTDAAFWDNKREFYTSSSKLDVFKGILPAWDRLLLDLYYTPTEGMSNEQTATMSDLIAVTSKQGISDLQAISRAFQDRWQSPKDGAMPFPQFDGITLYRSTQLDTELLEQTRAATAGGNAQYTGTAYTQPRYYIINRKHFGPVFQEDRIMKKRPIRDLGALQPDVFVRYTESYFNLFTNDLRKHGIIAPAA